MPSHSVGPASTCAMPASAPLVGAWCHPCRSRVRARRYRLQPHHRRAAARSAHHRAGAAAAAAAAHQHRAAAARRRGARARVHRRQRACRRYNRRAPRATNQPNPRPRSERCITSALTRAHARRDAPETAFSASSAWRALRLKRASATALIRIAALRSHPGWMPRASATARRLKRRAAPRATSRAPCRARTASSASSRSETVRVP